MCLLNWHIELVMPDVDSVTDISYLDIVQLLISHNKIILCQPISINAGCGISTLWLNCIVMFLWKSGMMLVTDKLFC